MTEVTKMANLDKLKLAKRLDEISLGLTYDESALKQAREFSNVQQDIAIFAYLQGMTKLHHRCDLQRLAIHIRTCTQSASGR